MSIMTPDYTHSILNVTATILKKYQAPTRYPELQVLADAIQDKGHVVLVLLDGMGMNLLSKHLSRGAFLLKHLKDVITSVFPPTTVAATNTVLSGLPPYQSGYLGWVQYFPKEDANIVVFQNQDFYDTNRNFDINFREKYLKYPLIYEQIRKHSADHITLHELFPNFREDGYASFKDQVDKVIEITRLHPKSFTYVYWTDPDLTEHQYGVDAYATRNVVQHLDEELERMAFFSAKNTAIIVIADHGLTDVSEVDLFKDQILMNMLKRLPSMEPRATNFFVKTKFKLEFKAHFEKNYGENFLLLTKEELLAKEWLGTGKKHKMLNQFLGDYIAIATGKMMMKIGEGKSFVAHHAGLTQEEMEVPLVIFTK
ncbi:MAG: hypothetical protein C4537_03225 [Acholeplasma sp.]|jgi:predicted AlkP superfamily pyrophosphatase or phosphodiesterase|nr:MAG: hypothetical protein C4537_03225 [Acholeplasma sp.]